MAVLILAAPMKADESHLPDRCYQKEVGHSAKASSEQSMGLSMLKWGLGVAVVFGLLACLIPNSSGAGTHAH